MGTSVSLLAWVSHQQNCASLKLQAPRHSKHPSICDFVAQDAKQGPVADDLQEVKSFDFKTLIKRRPDLKQELLGFRDHLLATSSTEETLKAWSRAPHHEAHLMLNPAIMIAAYYSGKMTPESFGGPEPAFTST